MPEGPKDLTGFSRWLGMRRNLPVRPVWLSLRIVKTCQICGADFPAAGRAGGAASGGCGIVGATGGRPPHRPSAPVGWRQACTMRQKVILRLTRWEKSL
ncbi:MAG TPA: hypothetical protein VMT91_05670 [Anaerolineales bacterium]|nr:hypothetical protein [Anaerolineales bacterium]